MKGQFQKFSFYAILFSSDVTTWFSKGTAFAGSAVQLLRLGTSGNWNYFCEYVILEMVCNKTLILNQFTKMLHDIILTISSRTKKIYRQRNVNI